MSVAQLTADLLAPKGAAMPVDGVYEHPMQKPMLTFAVPAALPQAVDIGGAEQANRSSPRGAPFRLSCRIARDQHRQLRIVAARRDVTLQQVLREAIGGYLEREGRRCGCLGAAFCDADC